MKTKFFLMTLIFLTHFKSHALCFNPGDAVQVATLSHPNLKENSGIDFSNKHEGIFWTLNDGNKTEIYAIGVDGTDYGTFFINGSIKKDWEDIALAKCLHNPAKDCIYIADFGNNDLNRPDFTIYVVEEPENFTTSAALKVVETINFKVPGSHNFEALAVNEEKEEIYLISKNEDVSSVFTLKKGSQQAIPLHTLNFNQVAIPLKRKDKIITAADFDNSSNTLLLGTNDNAFEIKLSDLPEFKDKIRKIKVPKMKQTEAIAYYWKNGKVHIVATSEGKKQPLYRISCD